eukprot:COSAG05_NODE_18819_length_302_cov_0.788177_2_plen_49_part_01
MLLSFDWRGGVALRRGDGGNAGGSLIVATRPPNLPAQRQLQRAGRCQLP